MNDKAWNRAGGCRCGRVRFEVRAAPLITMACHCAWCMSWMFTRPEGLEAFVNLRPTMLDDAGGCAPFVETMTREKLAWVETPAVHRFDGFPQMEQFASLLEEYPSWKPPA